jgi:hypothetical protein
MIDAGVVELKKFDLRFDSFDEAVIRIYEAMYRRRVATRCTDEHDGADSDRAAVALAEPSQSGVGRDGWFSLSEQGVGGTWSDGQKGISRELRSQGAAPPPGGCEGRAPPVADPGL